MLSEMYGYVHSLRQPTRSCVPAAMRGQYGRQLEVAVVEERPKAGGPTLIHRGSRILNAPPCKVIAPFEELVPSKDKGAYVEKSPALPESRSPMMSPNSPSTELKISMTKIFTNLFDYVSTTTTVNVVPRLQARICRIC